MKLIIEHGGDMAKFRVVAKDKSCCFMLDHFDLVNIPFSIRIPL